MQTITIKDKKYSISIIDTEDTVLNKIAIEEQTLPKYIKIDLFNPLNKKIEVSFLKDDIIKKPLKIIKDIYTKWKNLSPTLIALEWIKVNKKGIINTFDDAFIAEMKDISSTDFWNGDAIETSYKNYIQNFDTEFKKLLLTVEEEKKFSKEYNNYVPVETTSFIQDSVIIDYELELNCDPMELFDNIVLDNNIPFVVLKDSDQNYYKIIKGILPEDNWLNPDAGTLVFKLYQNAKEQWGTATINYISMEQPYKAILTIETLIGVDSEGKKTSEEQIKNNILNVMKNCGINIINRTEKGIKGVFGVPDIFISRDVILDLITNEPMVSHYLYVDETRDLSSIKGVLYLYFSAGDTDTNVLTIFLSDKIVSRIDQFYLNKELPLYTQYLNVRISRATNLEQINRFKTAFALILDLYKKKYNNIVKLYTQYIPSFKSDNEIVKKETEDKKLLALQAQASDLFIHGYPTSCEKKKQPIPVPEKDVAKLENKGIQVLNYPKGSVNYYKCDDDEQYNYPGLMKNKLANKDQYPYLPCCYPTDQKTGTKLWNLYLNNEIKDNPYKPSNIVSKKIVVDGKIGYLPRNIYHILNKDKSPEDEFYRMGVPISTSSFIEVILLALDPKYEKLDNDSKRKYVNDFRTNLAGKDMINVIQQLYDTNSATITNNIMNMDLPFDSQYYIGLLEAYYNCQIVVFVRNDEDPNGQFEIPRYTQGYLYRKIDPNKKTVLVYKHMGIRSDNLESPHYELIIKKFKKITIWYFESSIILRNIYSYFLQFYKLYCIGMNRYISTPSPPLSFLDAKGQLIDRYGKCRGYFFDKNIFIATSPIEPAYNLPKLDMPSNYPEWKLVEKFIKDRNLIVTYQDVNNNTTIGVMIDYPNINYMYIPCKPTSEIKGIKSGSNLGIYLPSKNNILQQTVINRKIADFMMQYLLYGFSNWYQSKLDTAVLKDKYEKLYKLSIIEQNVKEQEILLKYIEEYLSKQIVVKENHDYKLSTLSRKLTLNSEFFAKDKLIVNSELTKQKLGYYLRFMLYKNKQLILNYHKKNFLDNYYTYTNDFIQNDNQLVFIGEISIENWSNTQLHGINNMVHRVPHSDIKEPYFFSHWAINNSRPFIIQNVNEGSLLRALHVSKIYIDNNYNSGFNTIELNIDNEITYTTYSIDNGFLVKEGNGPLTVWKFNEETYAAMLNIF
jgi:hypothetical protein